MTTSALQPNPVADSRWFTPRLVVGSVALLSSTAAALLLVLSHLQRLSLPGCGQDAGCASLAEGRWGNIAGWPVSFLGLAWFSGLLVMWLLSRGRVSTGALWLIRLGALASLSFLGLMIVERQFCGYCVLVHVGNLVFLAVAEWSNWPRGSSPPSAAVPSRLPVAGLVSTMLCISLALALYRGRVVTDLKATAHREAQSTVAEILKSDSIENASPIMRPVFTGRWRRGPEESAIRVVIFGDFQCEDCRNVDHELATLLVGRTDISVSVRHFPLCRDCNRTIRHPKFHDNACVAARAAEAAGELGQTDGFWKLHEWLFARDGKFTEQELHATLPELGFPDVSQFTLAMQQSEVEQRIQQDVEEAVSLGIDGTPLVYVNGVELPNADVPGTLTQAIDALTKQNLPPKSAAVDVPRGPVERLVSRWQDGPTVELPDSLPGWTVGSPTAVVKMTLVYDYANPYTPWLDEVARKVAAAHPEVQLKLVLFPLSKSLNPRFDKWEHDFYGPSTEMARLAKASSDLGGDAAFLSVHQWILQHQAGFDLAQGVQQAVSLGLDEQPLRECMASDAVTESLVGSIQAVESAEIKWASTLYVNGRRVTALLPTEELLERIIGLAVEH